MLQEKHKQARMHRANAWLEDGEEVLTTRGSIDKTKGLFAAWRQAVLACTDQHHELCA